VHLAIKSVQVHVPLRKGLFFAQVVLAWDFNALLVELGQVGTQLFKVHDLLAGIDNLEDIVSEVAELQQSLGQVPLFRFFFQEISLEAWRQRYKQLAGLDLVLLVHVVCIEALQEVFEALLDLAMLEETIHLDAM